MKKSLLMFTALAAVSMMGATGCTKKADFNIGICQLVRHVALNEATKGFQDALKEKMKEAGKSVSFDLQIAGGEANNCSVIASNFVAKKKDLIMANATPALLAARNSTTTIPVLGTSITEYSSIVGKEDLSHGTGTNVSGTSDLASLDEQAQMIIDNFPTRTKVGILYCTGESNSKYQADQVKAYLEAHNRTVDVITFATANDLSASLTGKINKVDVLYIPTDNTCADSATLIDSICHNANVPVVAGEEGICKKCGTFTFSISYYNIGLETGYMAAEILLEGADIKTMPIRYDNSPVKKYNPEICARFDLEIPEGYVAIE